MLRLRFIVILLIIWLTVLFNIERSDMLGVDLPTAVYVASVLAVGLVLALPETIAARWYIVLTPLLLAYAAYRYPLIAGGNVPPYVFILIEWVMIAVAFFMGRGLSATISNIERTYDTLVENEGNLRVLSGVAGDQQINQELFRARRYDRPVCILYVKTPSLKQLERIYNRYLSYQVSLQQRYVKARIAQLAESMLYAGDPIAWHTEDIVICLPETDKIQAYELAGRIAKVVKFSLNIDVPIGIATFPTQGLIYDDLVREAYEDLQYFTSDQAVGDDTAPIFPLSTGSDDNDDNPPPSSDEIDYDAPGFTKTQPYKPPEQQPLPTQLMEHMRLSLRQWYSAVEHDIDLLPPEEYAIKGNIDGKPFYNPDFWVNRVPRQAASNRRIYRYVKRSMDILLVVLASPVLIPLCATVAALIKLEDGGTVLFSQPRTGEGGHQFRMYKFRSMVPNAEEVRQQYGIMTNERGETIDRYGNKLEADPRVTRIGAFIRKTSIDELPQLWNVLRGDMSLVGPRPTSYGVEKYTLFQTQRLSIKPGITGLWQVYDRNDTDFDNRLIWDIKYIDKMSFGLDVQILFRTVVMQVLKRRGA